MLPAAFYSVVLIWACQSVAFWASRPPLHTLHKLAGEQIHAAPPSGKERSATGKQREARGTDMTPAKQRTKGALEGKELSPPGGYVERRVWREV